MTMRILEWMKLYLYKDRRKEPKLRWYWILEQFQGHDIQYQDRWKSYLFGYWPLLSIARDLQCWKTTNPRLKLQSVRTRMQSNHKQLLLSISKVWPILASFLAFILLERVVSKIEKFESFQLEKSKVSVMLESIIEFGEINQNDNIFPTKVELSNFQRPFWLQWDFSNWAELGQLRWSLRLKFFQLHLFNFYFDFPSFELSNFSIFHLPFPITWMPFLP